MIQDRSFNNNTAKAMDFTLLFYILVLDLQG